MCGPAVCVLAAVSAAAVSLQVFLQRSAVNLLGVVLDVPEFFWSAPDHLQVWSRGRGEESCMSGFWGGGKVGCLAVSLTKCLWGAG